MTTPTTAATATATATATPATPAAIAMTATTSTGATTTTAATIPGEILTDDDAGDRLLNPGRATVAVDVTNTGDRPIQVGSHYHFAETNAALTFDRAAAHGRRLAIASGTAVRFEPGQTRSVTLVAYAATGTRPVAVWGFRGLVNGALQP